MSFLSHKSIVLLLCCQLFLLLLHHLLFEHSCLKYFLRFFVLESPFLYLFLSILKSRFLFFSHLLNVWLSWWGIKLVWPHRINWMLSVIFPIYGTITSWNWRNSMWPTWLGFFLLVSVWCHKIVSPCHESSRHPTCETFPCSIRLIIHFNFR